MECLSACEMYEIEGGLSLKCTLYLIEMGVVTGVGIAALSPFALPVVFAMAGAMLANAPC